MVAAALAIMASCGRSDRSRGAADSPAAKSALDISPIARLDSGAVRFLPRDDADESFQQFRDSALSSLSRKDTTFLFAMLAPEIRNSFGDDGGVQNFRGRWNVEDPHSGIWLTLIRILSLGGKRTSDTSFVAPYVYAFWPDSLDASQHVAVTKPVASVFGHARNAAHGVVSHSILEFLGWRRDPAPLGTTDTTFAHVALGERDIGYLRAADVYSPTGWRAFFVKRQGRWQMTALVNGD